MKRTKLISVLVAAIVVTSLMSGCKKNENPKDSNESDKSPITLTMFSKDVNNNYEDFKSPVAKKNQEATGVTLKEEFPVGDLDQAISIMIAGDKYPDLIFSDQTKYIDAGALIKLDDLIDKYGPHIKALYGNYLNRLKHSTTDQSIYFLGSYQVDQTRYEPNMAFPIQQAVLKDAGYPQVKTLDDAEKLIKAYKDKYPTIDGQPTIGLSLIADDWRWTCSIGNMAAFTTGKPDDGNWYVDPNTRKAVYRFTLDDHKEYFKWLNHMNSIGLLDPDSFTQKYDQYQAKISSGRVLALNDQIWQYRDAEKALVTAGKNDRTYAQLPVQVDSSTKCADFEDYGYSPSYGIGISKSCKDPVRAIKFLDWMCSDEAQVLNNWGIEGVNYTVKDGKRVRTAEEIKARNSDKDYSKRTGIGVYTYPFPQRGDGLTDSTGNTYTVTTADDFINAYNPAAKETLAAYGVKMWKDLYPKTSDLPKQSWGQAWGINIPQDSELNVQLQKCNDLVKAAIPKMVLAKPADFDGIWAQLQADLKKAGVDEAGQEFTKLLQARYDLWNK